MIMLLGQTARAYNVVVQQVEVIHTVPAMTDTERRAAEKRVSSELFEVLSGIYEKLKSDSE
jgi:hypothetical protein